MGAIKPWHLLICLVVVLVVIGAAIALGRAGRRK
jgi:Sec-independent protein translocase protein TatA